MAYTLTIRHGPKVTRERFEFLEQALAALRERAEQVKAEGGLQEVKLFRTYAAERQVAARIEISTGRLLSAREAGVDVMGDGSMIPFAGSFRRRHLAPPRGTSPYDAVREALER